MGEQTKNMRWLVRPARLLPLPFLILNFAPSAYSQARPSVFLEDLTWTELRDEIGAGKTTIIVPIGGNRAERPGYGAWKTQSARQVAKRADCSLVGQRACRSRDRLRPRRQFKSAVRPPAFPWNDRRAGSRV